MRTNQQQTNLTVDIFTEKQLRGSLFVAENQETDTSLIETLSKQLSLNEQNHFVAKQNLDFSYRQQLLQSKVCFQNSETSAKIVAALFQISDTIIPISSFIKIKITNQELVSNNSRLKIVTKTQSILLGLNKQQQYAKFPLQYFWFARIIVLRLLNEGIDFQRTYSVFKNAIKKKFEKEGIISGMIYKRSQHLKKWQIRYVVVQKDGLHSYRQEQKQTFKIPFGSVSEMWTRFQLTNRMLVLKIKSGTRKIQFGIPIQDFCEQCQNNWLFAFYRLMKCI